LALLTALGPRATFGRATSSPSCALSKKRLKQKARGRIEGKGIEVIMRMRGEERGRGEGERRGGEERGRWVFT
jgi:hypothetical protein